MERPFYPQQILKTEYGDIVVTMDAKNRASVAGILKVNSKDYSLSGEAGGGDGYEHPRIGSVEIVDMDTKENCPDEVYLDIQNRYLLPLESTITLFTESNNLLIEYMAALDEYQPIALKAVQLKYKAEKAFRAWRDSK